MTSVTEGCNDEVIVTDEAEGEWTGKYLIQASNEPINGWDLQLVFSAPLDYLGKECRQIISRCHQPPTQLQGLIN